MNYILLPLLFSARVCAGVLRCALPALLFLTLLLPAAATAQTREHRFNVYFRVGGAAIDTALTGNAATLDSLRSLAALTGPQGPLTVRAIRYEGYASPEGPAALNRRLSQLRREALEAFVSSCFAGLDSPVSRGHLVYDPAAAESYSRASEAERSQMVREFGPLRYASAVIVSETKPEPQPVCELSAEPEHRQTADTVLTATADSLPDPEPEVDVCKPLYIGFKSNLLYDAVLIPTLGAEFYVGRGLSIAGQWSYAWWSRNARHRYWRYYGGDLGLRRWFGRSASNKPLTGHHIGVYGQLFTYDFETGGSGQMGAKFNYGGGIEYGFSLPVARRLNIDFTIGVGYIGGKYYKYTPVDGHYVWQSTHSRHWFGPTKAEVSLVWLVGCGNSNVKGGATR